MQLFDGRATCCVRKRDTLTARAVEERMLPERRRLRMPVGLSRLRARLVSRALCAYSPAPVTGLFF